MQDFTQFTGAETIVALGAIRTTDTGPALVLNGGLVASPHVFRLPADDLRALSALNFTYWSNVPPSERPRVARLVNDGYAAVLTASTLMALVPVIRVGVSVDAQTEGGYRISFDAHSERQTLEIDTWQASLLKRMGAPVPIAELIGEVVREVESDAEEAAAARAEEETSGESLQMFLLKTAISFFGALKAGGALTIEPGE